MGSGYTPTTKETNIKSHCRGLCSLVACWFRQLSDILKVITYKLSQDKWTPEKCWIRYLLYIWYYYTDYLDNWRITGGYQNYVTRWHSEIIPGVCNIRTKERERANRFYRFVCKLYFFQRKMVKSAIL